MPVPPPQPPTHHNPNLPSILPGSLTGGVPGDSFVKS